MRHISRAAEVEGRCREIGKILREVVGEMPRQGQKIGRRRDLHRIGQARGVVVERVAHAQIARLGCHQLGEMALRAAQGLADRDRNVVGRAHHDRLDRGVHIDHVAGIEMQIGRPLRRGVFRNRQHGLHRDVAALERLEQQIQRHHLGQRRGMTLGISVARIKDAAGFAVGDQGGVLHGIGGACGQGGTRPAAAVMPVMATRESSVRTGHQGQSDQHRHEQRSHERAESGARLFKHHSPNLFLSAPQTDSI